jgi:hypothetical protein
MRVAALPWDPVARRAKNFHAIAGPHRALRSHMDRNEKRKTSATRNNNQCRTHGIFGLAALGLLLISSGCQGITGQVAASAAPSTSDSISVNLTPGTGSVLLGNAMSLTPTVSNATNTGVIWTVAGVPGGNSTVGTISASGIFTAPQSLPVPATEVVQAASAADVTKTASATITILSDIAITLAPLSAAVELGAAQDFQPNLISGGRPIAAMNWSIQGAGCTGAACGTITSGGFFMAPQYCRTRPRCC